MKKVKKKIIFLELEPKYISPAIPDIKKIIPDIENIVQATIDYHKAEICNIMFHEANKLFNKPIKSTYKKIKNNKNLRQVYSISVMLTEKSNKLAILNREDYIDKMNNRIKDIQCEKIKIDPVNLFTEKVNDIIENGTWHLYMEKGIEGTQTSCFFQNY